MKSLVAQDSDIKQLEDSVMTSKEWEETPPDHISYEGETVTIELGRGMLERIRKLASEEGIAYQDLLARWIQVGMIAHGKKRRKVKVKTDRSHNVHILW